MTQRILYYCVVLVEAFVSDDMNENFAKEVKQMSNQVANGDINPTLAEKHMRDWTKRMHSLKRLDLEKRLQVSSSLY